MGIELTHIYNIHLPLFHKLEAFQSANLNLSGHGIGYYSSEIFQNHFDQFVLSNVVLRNTFKYLSKTM